MLNRQSRLSALICAFAKSNRLFIDVYIFVENT